MSTTSQRLCAAASLLVLLSACATRTYVTELPTNLDTGKAVEGIPFRMKENYTLKLYHWEKDKYVEITPQNTATMAPLANRDRLYLLHLSASTFADGTVNHVMDDDNTLVSVNVVSSNKADAALDAVSAAAKAVREARDTKTQSDQADTNSKEDTFVTALDAKSAADSAQLELDALPADATPLVRQQAKDKVRKARVLANQKARRAGLPVPFADEQFSRHDAPGVDAPGWPSNA